MNCLKNKYHLRALDFYICRIGRDIELSRDLNDLEKNKESDFHVNSFLSGITNGEYIFSIYNVVKCLTDDSIDRTINLAQMAVFYDLHCNAIDDFKDSWLDEWCFSEYDGIDCWNLYSVCSRNQKLPLHSYRKKKISHKPMLAAITKKEWEYIHGIIEKEFFYDCNFGVKKHIRMLDNKLPDPTSKQYKEAVEYISNAYINIWYNKSRFVDKYTNFIQNRFEKKVKECSDRSDFFALMKAIQKTMADEYELIRSRAAEDPGTAGDQVEENWAQFLRKWLPANYPIVTKGRLIDINGNSSPQIDILVLHPSYPLGLRNNKYYFSSGVIAAFECKLTLKKEHLDKFFRNSIVIKNMNDPKCGNPYDELCQLPLYGLLAYSHRWKDNKSAVSRIHEMLWSESNRNCKHPREMPDVICISDTSTFYLGRDIRIGPHSLADIDDDLEYFDKDGVVRTTYFSTSEYYSDSVDDKGEILGGLIFNIIKRMAYDDKKLRPFADYLSDISMWIALGKIGTWSKIVLSDKTGKKLIEKGYDESPWSKWSDSY